MTNNKNNDAKTELSAEKSLEIIDILAQDSRTSPALIASMINVEKCHVENEIDRLEKENIILKYTTVINEEKTQDASTVHALIEVRVMPQYQHGYEAIAKSICMYDEVRSCFLMSGTYDYMVLIEGNSIRDIARFVAEKLSVLEGVTGTATNFVLRKYKDNHTVIPFENSDKRQIVTP